MRQVVTADGAAIKLNGHRVNVLGVNPGQFRVLDPLATATDQRLWTALGQGRFVASDTLAGLRKLHVGTKYMISGARQEQLAFGGSAPRASQISTRWSATGPRHSSAWCRGCWPWSARRGSAWPG